MAKFPTEVERSVTVRTDMGRVYRYLWDVVGSSSCIPGLKSCKQVADDTYCFVFEERSTGPVSLMIKYTAAYEGNGKNRITFRSVSAGGDNAETSGVARLQPSGSGSTRLVFRQMIAPETPIPRLVQGLVRSFVEREAADGVREFLANVKRELEKSA